MLHVKNLSGGYNGYSVLNNVSFSVERGELFGILGPNGSGKTTLLKMISGLLLPEQGEVLVKSRPLQSYHSKELAKIIAVLPQVSSEVFAYTVKEAVALGRYAHQSGWLQSRYADDEEIVKEAMKLTGVTKYQNKLLNELSGGERQRVFLAQALAQEPEILLLDEPTNHLDISYQKELLDQLKKWTKKRGLTVISIFHDVNLAALYCDRLLLLNEGQINIVDQPNEVLQERRIQQVYKTDIAKQPHPIVPKPQMILLPDKSETVEELSIDERYLKTSDEMIEIRSPIPLKTMSSAVIGAGIGWYHTFVNCHASQDHQQELSSFLKEKGLNPSNTVGMLTTIQLEDAYSQSFYGEGFSIFVVVTTCIEKAADESREVKHSLNLVAGTINTWVFINGHISDEAFIQSMMIATEAKVEALRDMNVTNQNMNDSVTDGTLVAATQTGVELRNADSLGKLIYSGVYKCTKSAILKNKMRMLND
ncbi:ATP-binding cassette domain-containing protein [Lederbergia citrea]|uniref:ATP-binding cassette domain-containing protein n=1 Tax=Lederbergia citrea TaxID=2833581 RepID=A0A942Z3D4_9BACI|nr:ATP-binding cassette domain-containing protein [Lederbergia citrea]MBS4223468.1 ATP-binding cassette domain-containing protein [Lederbergia citrea]